MTQLCGRKHALMLRANAYGTTAVGVEPIANIQACHDSPESRLRHLQDDCRAWLRMHRSDLDDLFDRKSPLR